MLSLHSSNEPSELSQWPCLDATYNATINIGISSIIIVIINDTTPWILPF